MFPKQQITAARILSA